MNTPFLFFFSFSFSYFFPSFSFGFICTSSPTPPTGQPLPTTLLLHPLVFSIAVELSRHKPPMGSHPTVFSSKRVEEIMDMFAPAQQCQQHISQSRRVFSAAYAA
jgi:hypothetical protein